MYQLFPNKSGDTAINTLKQTHFNCFVGIHDKYSGSENLAVHGPAKATL